MIKHLNSSLAGLLVSITCIIGHIQAQADTGRNYAKSPYWIKMMKDTNTNYFIAVKAFNAYWKGREKPTGENEKFAKAGQEDKTKSKNVPYGIEYKQFQHWQMQVKPYVQNDGSILYPYQRHLLRQEARRATPTNTEK